ncbi:unnamed protein product [Musa acuminata var. zebrina]
MIWLLTIHEDNKFDGQVLSNTNISCFIISRIYPRVQMGFLPLQCKLPDFFHTRPRKMHRFAAETNIVHLCKHIMMSVAKYSSALLVKGCPQSRVIHLCPWISCRP